MISLTPLEELTSKHMREGESHPFLVANDVTENGVVAPGEVVTTITRERTAY